MLRGTEVKALRDGRADLKESYARARGARPGWSAVTSAPTPRAIAPTTTPCGPGKLLLHRREIGRLLGKIMEKGLTLVPLRLYFKAGRAKVEIGLARGRKTLDKRHAIREREERREMDRAVRDRVRW